MEEQSKYDCVLKHYEIMLVCNIIVDTGITDPRGHIQVHCTLCWIFAFIFDLVSVSRQDYLPAYLVLIRFVMTKVYTFSSGFLIQL
jgi:hypothetical protein